MAKYKDFTGKLNDTYGKFCERSLSNRRIKHSNIKPLIEKLRNNPVFSVSQVGMSAQNREIYLISMGSGKTKVFLWSQMHGDESTATMAIFDIFNFFAQKNEFEDFKSEILKSLTLYFIPMVNPDGAEIFERRNSYSIDLNRDAVRLQSPEARILKSTFDSLKADFGFNLHDQSIYYSAGKSFKSAAISFLAPPSGSDKAITPSREKAMRLIGQLNNVLIDFIPGHTGKYSDEYEPRAFGDNFQKWGMSTILIETGGLKGDPEKKHLRKLNFILLMTSFRSIAGNEYLNESPDTYESIPFNEKEGMMDLILRNLNYRTGNRNITVDVGINRTEYTTESGRTFYTVGRVADLGDLSVYGAYDDFDFSEMEISTGKTYGKTAASEEEISGIDFPGLYSRGYTNVKAGFAFPGKYSEYPINIVLKDCEREGNIKVDGPANFTISREGKVKFVVINGFLIEIENPQMTGINGEVIC